ncbi:CYTH domain-containing protein [Noviherbaspirillum saxi]|uniref:CYTH domain-containing protein n=1 Tax=Noviherbaspirillum saxi TaxID=2320863 RepID=A0A3A3FRC7_9BURK|nr:CYTH domain-containing protein [Noviherbaspirillum saxi]RJF98762.1 CYTH domain-containing protein [Noviherbaspirillum saxi]
MSVEIERKFLVVDDRWKSLGSGALLRQGYLSSNADRIVRVRIEGEDAMLTVKGRSVGATRGEWEYPIPLADAAQFLDSLCERPIIEKKRYRIVFEGMTWEVDEFMGDNAGLVVAEIELESEDQAFAKPDWIGVEVTHDARYFNSSLLKHPYSTW